ncbi:MAG: response regulator [Nitrospinae bacterium]|nr:response regulator [Nitrospinota bacterium]MBL7021502.1 response regulator [Nitrospinaceae bacterium]
MSDKNRPFILVAEDDEDDVFFLNQAIADMNWSVDLKYVKDGAELIDYLHRRGAYLSAKGSPFPNLILLDWNLPRKTGWEVLKDVKSNQELRSIPVVVLSTSRATQDINDVYTLGGNAFATKPNDFRIFVKSLRDFWFNAASLPSSAREPLCSNSSSQ